jgi:outer membrane protein OmpA-like peptidoglycan-associated protein
MKAIAQKYYLLLALLLVLAACGGHHGRRPSSGSKAMHKQGLVSKKRKQIKPKNTNAQMYARKTRKPPKDLSDCTQIGKKKIQPKVVKFPTREGVETKRTPEPRGTYDATWNKRTAKNERVPKNKTSLTTTEIGLTPGSQSGKITEEHISIETTPVEGYKTTLTTTTTGTPDSSGVSIEKRSRPFWNPLYFHFDQDELTEEDRKTLRTAMTYLDKGYVILLEGHTDSKGSHEYNDRLSLDRSTRIKALMIKEMSAPADKIFYAGHGKRRPAIHNENEITRQLNRRVEVKLLTPEEAAELVNKGEIKQ